MILCDLAPANNDLFHVFLIYDVFNVENTQIFYRKRVQFCRCDGISCLFNHVLYIQLIHGSAWITEACDDRHYSSNDKLNHIYIFEIVPPTYCSTLLKKLCDLINMSPRKFKTNQFNVINLLKWNQTWYVGAMSYSFSCLPARRYHGYLVEAGQCIYASTNCVIIGSVNALPPMWRQTIT